MLGVIHLVFMISNCYNNSCIYLSIVLSKMRDDRHLYLEVAGHTTGHNKVARKSLDKPLNTKQ